MRVILLACFAYSIFASSMDDKIFVKTMPEPYCNLEEILPFDNHSWYSNAMPMEKLVKQTNAKVVIELGSWLGHSTCHMAELVGSTGKVYAVDHWIGSQEHFEDNNVKDKIQTLYQKFLSNVIHYRKQNIVIPVKKTTKDAAQFFYDNKISPDLIYVDAAHDEESVYQDISLYFPLVKGHGVMCGDDWGWGELSVQKAVKRFAKENNLEIELHNNWFWIYREKS